jgi:hypothetical protein
MIAFREDTRPAHYARIVVDGFYSAGVRGNAVMRRGVEIAAIVDAFETRGIRCEVEHRLASLSSGDRWQCSIMLKQAHDPLNLDVLAFSLAHPAMYRRICFALQDAESVDTQRQYGIGAFGNYLYPVNMKEEPGEILFQGMNLEHNWTVENAAARVQAKLEKFTAAQTQ